MNKIYDLLETCLQELENGADVESLLERFPEYAEELRPLLKASIQARSLTVSVPSSDTIRRERAKFMQRAAELREQKSAPIILPRRVIPLFQRMAITLGLTSMLLVSGTGLVNASSSALPGENLYPVKRSWEGLRLFLTFNDDRHNFLENEFENERLEEVGDLISEGRHETIQFAGVYMVVNTLTYVSGVQVVISENTQLPQVIENGAAVVVTGHTNENGFVEAESIKLLPNGTVVPVGPPIGVESESSEDGKNSSSSGSVSGSDNETEENNSGKNNGSGSASFQIQGNVDSISNDTMVVNGQSMSIKGAEIKGKIKPGVNVEVEGFYSPDGTFIVTKVKVKDSNSGSGSNGGHSGSNSGSGSSGSGGDGGGDDDHGGGRGSGEGGGGDDDD